MSDKIMQYVIVGNGVAGMTAAEEIRKFDKDRKSTRLNSSHH